MLHECRPECRPPTIELHQIRADEQGIVVAYRAIERGCFPIAGVVLCALATDPAVPVKVIRIHLNDGEEGEFLQPSPGTAGILAVLAFDSSPERNTSLPSVEPMVGALPSGTAEAIRDEVQAHLVGFLTPERLAAAEELFLAQARDQAAAEPRIA